MDIHNNLIDHISTISTESLEQMKSIANIESQYPNKRIVNSKKRKYGHGNKSLLAVGDGICPDTVDCVDVPYLSSVASSFVNPFSVAPKHFKAELSRKIVKQTQTQIRNYKSQENIENNDVTPLSQQPSQQHHMHIDNIPEIFDNNSIQLHTEKTEDVTSEANNDVIDNNSDDSDIDSDNSTDIHPNRSTLHPSLQQQLSSLHGRTRTRFLRSLKYTAVMAGHLKPTKSDRGYTVCDQKGYIYDAVTTHVPILSQKQLSMLTPVTCEQALQHTGTHVCRKQRVKVKNMTLQKLKQSLSTKVGELDRKALKLVFNTLHFMDYTKQWKMTCTFELFMPHQSFCFYCCIVVAFYVRLYEPMILHIPIIALLYITK